MSTVQVIQNFDYNRYPGPTSTIRFNGSVLARLYKPYLEFPNPTPGIELEGEQKAARDDIVDWIIHPDVDDRVLTVGGYAGVGKSVLVRYIQAYLQVLGIKHTTVSLTGKAVEVLRKKGVDNAETIHSCLYTLDTEEKKRTGQLVFIKNPWLDQEIVLIDEAQILPNQSYKDFLSFPHVRLIAFGDHGQLESIGGDTIKLMQNPRVRLEEPRRQALGSNLLQFAHALRGRKRIPYGKCPGVTIAPRNLFWKDIANPLCDQIIVGFNKTRNQVNREVRKSRGYHGDLPNVGEKVICLYNTRDLGVYNGQTFLVESVANETDELVKLILDDCGTKYAVIAIKEQFGRDKLDLTLSRKFYPQGYRSVVFLDFAYAITAHKSMGSEFKRGKVLEEVHPDADLSRWSYTAATRFYEDIEYYR